MARDGRSAMLGALSKQQAAVARKMTRQVTRFDDGGTKFVGVPLLGEWPQTLPPTIEFTIAYDAVDDGWTQARIVELPAVITAGPTRAQAKELVLDALREYLLSLRAEAGGGDGERESVALTITA